MTKTSPHVKNDEDVDIAPAVSPESPTPRRFTILAVASIICALGIRLWFAYSSLGRLDSDEAITLLMARKIASGKPVVFFFGQSYGGSQEAILMSPFVKIFSTDTWIARLIPGAVTCVAALVIIYGFSYVRGKERFRDPFLWAGLIFLVVPASLIWWSVHSSGFYPMVMACGIISFSLGKTMCDSDVPPEASFRSRLSRHKALGFTLLGISIGCGWWASPQSMMFTVPLGLWMLPHYKILLRESGWLIGGFVIGSFPWLAENARSHLKSLDTGQFPPSTYAHRLKTFFVDGLPTLLNFRNWMAPVNEFYAPRTVAIIAALVLFCALVFVGIKNLMRDFTSPVSLFALALILYPLISSINPNSFYVGEARYQWFIIPSMCVLLCTLPHFVESRYVFTTVIVALLASSIVSTARSINYYDDTLSVAAPSNYGPVVRKIESLKMDSVAANYWTAYRLTAESDHKIVATPFDASMRIAADRDRVKNDLDGIVVSKNTVENVQIQKYLDSEKIPYHLYDFKNTEIYKIDSTHLSETQKFDIVSPPRIAYRVNKLSQ